MPKKTSTFLSGPAIETRPLSKDLTVTELVDTFFQAYNARRLGEACRVLTRKMLEPDVTVGLTLSGALTPAGLGATVLVPLIEAGFVDWIISTGANLYHDTHFALGHSLHRGSPFVDDTRLRAEGVIRIYDILFDYKVLLDTDAFYREILTLPEFQARMGTAEFHNRVGRYVQAREKTLKVPHKSLLTAAYECGVPVYTSSPGDSSIGMNIAATHLSGGKLLLDVALDVNETASLVYAAKKSGGKSGIWILGGGSPKNFALQTEPQIQEVLGLKEKGHDYFLQITDARPDTGGLSGATPSEAVSWGKVDPEQLPDSIVCYLDSTVALPILAAYALANHAPRPLKRLYDHREAYLARLTKDYRRRAKG